MLLISSLESFFKAASERVIVIKTSWSYFLHYFTAVANKTSARFCDTLYSGNVRKKYTQFPSVPGISRLNKFNWRNSYSIQDFVGYMFWSNINYTLIKKSDWIKSRGFTVICFLTGIYLSTSTTVTLEQRTKPVKSYQ